MMGRLGRSWELIKLSFNFIKDDTRVLLFPIISGIMLAMIFISYIGSIFFIGFFTLEGMVWVMVVGFFVLYLLFYIIGIYFNTALIAYVTIKLEGGNPELGDGFKAANENIAAIIKWALLAATVGMIIRTIQERVGIIGKIIIGLIGFAWAMATFFIIPVLIYEKKPLFESIKRSGHVFKETWGETLVSHFAIGLIFILIGMAAAFPLVLLMVFLGMAMGLVGFVIGLAILISMILFIAVIASAAHGIIVAALYRYATTGRLTPEIVPEYLLGI